MNSIEPYLGMTAKVHWHVTKKIYSVAVKGKVVAYVSKVAMTGVSFHLDARLRKKFEERPSRRTVHALVRGQLVAYDTPPNTTSNVVLCNPFTYRGFVRATDLAQAQAADLVLLRPDRVIEAYGLRCAEINAAT